MIELSKNLRIRKLDKYNLVVEIAHKQKKNNELRWNIEGYFPSLETALYSIISQELFSLIDTTDKKVELLKILEELTKLKTVIQEILKRNKIIDNI